MPIKPAHLFDGLKNFVSRVNTGADKAAHGIYMLDPVNQYDIDAAYSSSWLRKIVDIPPFDEVREGRTFVGADKDQITAIDAEIARLGMMPKIARARILARKDGGSAIVMGFGDNPAMPLDPKRVQQGGLKYINVCTRWDISPSEQDRDPNSPTFGGPKMYRLNNDVQTEVHPSRVIRFIGNPIERQGHWDGWGESIWAELRDAVKHSDAIAAGIAALVEEAKVDVVKIKDLMTNMASVEYENLLVRRWGLMGTFKSSQNALLLDAEDDFEQKTLTFGGMSDIQDRALMIMSGMSDIPATRLLGRSPQGMNATGDSDMRNYYDRIRAYQKVFLGPLIAPLDECVIRSALGDRPPEVYAEWNPLYTMSEKEAADVEKLFADTAAVYAGQALIPDTALAGMVKDGIIERGQWPGAEQAFEDAEAEGDLPGLLAEPTEAELAAEQAKTAVALATAANPSGMAPVKPKLVAANDARFTDATPRSLYVRRDVVNVAEIVKWAKSQGFTDIVPDLHVTIIYSRDPVDWMKMGASWESEMKIPAGGPRVMETFGENAQALLFASSELAWRNQAARDAGASFDFAEYQPHITISYGDMPDGVTPYQGKIVLSEEIFEEVKAD